jgi:hypothetical protein
MMGRPSRVPVDLQAVTKDVKAKIRRVIEELEAIKIVAPITRAELCVASKWMINARLGLSRRPDPQVYCTGAVPPFLHSAGPAHNLERIFYAILRLKAGR